MYLVVLQTKALLRIEGFEAKVKSSVWYCDEIGIEQVWRDRLRRGKRNRTIKKKKQETIRKFWGEQKNQKKQQVKYLGSTILSFGNTPRKDSKPNTR